MEPAPFVQLACQLNRAFHQIYNCLCNGHPKPSPHNLGYLVGILPLKAVKNLPLEFLRHSNPCVFHNKMGPYIIIPLGGLLLIQIDVNPPSLRRKLPCIGKEVQKHLVQAHGIAKYILRLDGLDKNIKILPFYFYLGPHNIYNVIHGFPQGHLVHVQRHLAALNFGHIQHVVNQPQQVFTGQLYFIQAVNQTIWVLYIFQGNLRHPDNRIHRRPDIMAHAGQELALGPI